MWEFLLFLGMIAGLVIIPFGFPGTILILASILIYCIATNFNEAIGVPFFILLCVMTLVAETADNWLTAIGARHYGASTGSIWLSFFGGLIGAIMIGGPAAIIFGPLGPVAGGFIGAFIAVVAWELYRQKSMHEALRAGWGSFVGRMAGIVLKVVMSVAMIIAVALSVLFHS
jgi:uncharacterized protein YqgC (DUF456 family)